MKKLAVIVPCYNEEAVIEESYRRTIGVFYEEKGYFGMSHSRIRRAEILLEFMREQKSEDAVLQMLEESLTFDLYYRENCKSRPFWAPSPAEFKEQTRYYCKNGVKSHVEPFHYRFPEKSKKALNEIPTRLKQPVYMLFDYENRDPLDHQAHVCVWTDSGSSAPISQAGSAPDSDETHTHSDTLLRSFSHPEITLRSQTSQLH